LSKIFATPKSALKYCKAHDLPYSFIQKIRTPKEIKKYYKGTNIVKRIAFVTVTEYKIKGGE